MLRATCRCSRGNVGKSSTVTAFPRERLGARAAASSDTCQIQSRRLKTTYSVTLTPTISSTAKG